MDTVIIPWVKEMYLYHDKLSTLQNDNEWSQASNVWSVLEIN